MPHSTEERQFVLVASANETDRGAVSNWFMARWNSIYGAVLEEARAELTLGEQRQEADAAELKEIVHAKGQKSRHVPDPLPQPQMPSGMSGWGVVALFLLLLLDAGAGWWNMAGYAVNHTQDWLQAFLFAAPMILLPVAAKFVLGQPVGLARTWAFRAVTLAGSIACLLFVFTFANHFAGPGGGSGMLGGAGASDMRLQLVSQMLLSVAIGVALLCYIRSLLVPSARLLPNPDWAVLDASEQSLRGRMEARARDIGVVRGVLADYENARTAYIGKWDQFFLALQSERQSAASRAAELTNWG